MKKMIYLALIVLFLFASCNASPEENGIGLIKLSFDSFDGINSYSIIITDKSGNEVKNVSIGVENLTNAKSWSTELAPGVYSIAVAAKDQDGNTLLFGEKDGVVVSKNQDSSVSMHLDVGVGKLELSLSVSNENHFLTIIDDVKIERLGSSFTITIDKDTIENGYLKYDSLPAGEYLATIKYSISMPEGFEKTGEHLELISIQNGELTSIEAKISYGGSSQIVIGDMVGNPVTMFSLDFSYKSESNDDSVDFYIPEKTEVVVTANGIDSSLYSLAWSISKNPKVSISVDEGNPNVAIIYADDIAAFKLELLVEGKSGKRYEKGFISLSLESQAIEL